MPIQVTCPKCLKRFQVSEKFAGRTGPCPSCKNPIKIPEADEQVVIHDAPTDAPKDSTGTSILKPITREDPNVTRKGLVITIIGVIGLFAAAYGARSLGEGTAPLWAQILGLALLAPPLVWVGYTLVYDRELAPYQGSELWQRVLILAGIFFALWAVYVFAPAYVLELDSPDQMSWTVAGISLAIMIGLGAVAAIATFEVEFSGGLVQSGLYFLTAIALAMVAGVTLAGNEPPTIPGLPTTMAPMEPPPVATVHRDAA